MNFRIYDYVMLNKNYSSCSMIKGGKEKKLKHDCAGKKAIIVDGSDPYSLYFKDIGKISYFPASALTLIIHNQVKLLNKWQKEAEEEKKITSDLDWIFKNGKSVIKGCNGFTILALWNCLESSNIWGSRGEGYVYYSNASAIMNLVKPFLKKKNKDGWIKYCEQLKNRNKIK